MCTWLLVGGPRHGEEISMPLYPSMDIAVFNGGVMMTGGEPSEPVIARFKTARYRMSPVMVDGDGEPTQDVQVVAGIFDGYR